MFGSLDLHLSQKFIEFTKPYDIEVLINNAGFGHNDSFSVALLEKELDMIDLNIKAHYKN